ncbi:hypothetical protein [Actinomadura rayongensis]|uniref:4-hydroxy-3-methylbut-2-enyl diphosphate reductase n=1 Tax=Actinomadura rayongensis TaxID=1429076 RepID=A0A6I4WHV1_9ACTN|nr:hypothetical protein [Actinomadura rayongensis]MXQ66182.1 hypothetical protein [Actinomadura rayongensis]
MKLTLQRRQVRVPDGRIGCVLVLPWFTDPERGVVRCDAAPLLVEWMSETLARGAGNDRVVELRAVPGGGEIGAGPSAAGVLSAVSWVGRDGGVGGFALVAHRDDGVASAAVSAAMGRWTALLRSRRLLVTDMPALCRGGRRAARMIDGMARAATRSDGGRVFVVGRPVTGAPWPTGWEQAGVVCVDDLDAVPDGAPVAFPAHGVPPAVRAEAARRRLRVIDGTCPLVTAVQADAAAYAARGDRVVVIGDRRHASLPVLTACAGPAAEVVHDVADVPAAARARDAVSFVIDPGMAVEDALPIVTALRDHVPELAGHHFDVLCDAASDRAQTIASVSSGSELTFVLAADERDPDVRVARRSARFPAVRVVTRLADLEAEPLAGATALGLVVTRSAPAGLREQVVAALAGLGPLTCRRRSVDTTPYPVRAAGPVEDAPAGGAVAERPDSLV